MKIFVKVKPRAKQEKVEKNDKGHFTVWVSKAPEKGKANKAVLKLLSEHFQIPVSEIKIVSGHKSKNKLIEIESYDKV